MPNPTSNAAIYAGYTPRFNYNKASLTTKGTGFFHSLWKGAGNPPAGATPPAFGSGAGYVPTNGTLGAIPFQNPGALLDSYLARLGVAGATSGTLIVYDRLWHCSGLATNITTAQNIVTPGDAGRVLGYSQVELWGEIYAAPGATAATWTVGYTDEANNAGSSATYAHPASAEVVGQMVPFVLGAGDYGVRSVQSFTCSVSSGTAGDVGLTLLRRVAEIPIDIKENVQDAFALGLPEVLDNACLAMMVLCSTTSTGYIAGAVNATQT